MAGSSIAADVFLQRTPAERVWQVNAVLIYVKVHCTQSKPNRTGRFIKGREGENELEVYTSVPLLKRVRKPSTRLIVRKVAAPTPAAERCSPRLPISLPPTGNIAPRFNLHGEIERGGEPTHELEIRRFLLWRVMQPAALFADTIRGPRTQPLTNATRRSLLQPIS